MSASLLSVVESPVKFEDLPERPNLFLNDLSDEIYREYEFPSGRIYRISDPVGVYIRNGGTTHRVVDQKGVAHCIPFGGKNEVVLRWKNRPGRDPAAW